jgi:5-methyltetrahydrofolate--homocysteine methyltransferase
MENAMAKTPFLERLAVGAVLISDGATGTNLQKRGLPIGAAAELWVLEAPDEIRALNQAFIQAGAEILLTCTFGASRHRLAASGLAEHFEAINRAALAITLDAAAEHDVLVAGSIGPLGQMLAPFGEVTVEEAEADFREQAAILCQEGADLIVVETQYDINEASAAVRAVRSVDTEIPLVCSFSYDRGTRTMMGVSPERMAEEIDVLDVDLLGINCGRSLEDNLAALTLLRAATEKPLWFKPNAGLPEVGMDGEAVYAVTPEEMADLVPGWVAAGARVIGGCCGTSPEHLRALARAVHANRE